MLAHQRFPCAVWVDRGVGGYGAGCVVEVGFCAEGRGRERRVGPAGVVLRSET